MRSYSAMVMAVTSCACIGTYAEEADPPAARACHRGSANTTEVSIWRSGTVQ